MKARLAILCILLGASCRATLPDPRIFEFEGFGSSTTASERLERGERDLVMGHVDESVKLAKELRGEYPKNFLVHRFYQDAMIAADRKAEIFEEYRKWCVEKPGPLSFTMFSRVQENPADGVAQAIRALDMDDRFPWAWYARGWWLAQKEETTKDAEQCFRRALELHPDFFLAMRSYAMLFREKDASAALDAIEKYIQRYPDHWDERLTYAWLLLEDLGRAARAEAEFRALLTIRPDDLNSAHGLAMALLDRDAVDEAKAIYERCAREHPDEPVFEFNLGKVAEFYEKNLVAAAEHYRKFLARADGQPFSWQVQARIALQDIEKQLSPASEPAGETGSQK